MGNSDHLSVSTIKQKLYSTCPIYFLNKLSSASIISYKSYVVLCETRGF